MALDSRSYAIDKRTEEKISSQPDSIFRHIVKTRNETGQIVENVFRNRNVALAFRKTAIQNGTFEGYELRTVGWERRPWKGNIRESSL